MRFRRPYSPPPTWWVVCALVIAAHTSRADERDRVTFGPHDVKTVFAIGKSDDGNQVQYALQLDEACHPRGADPIFGYWREYDRHERLLPFSLLDQIGYGIAGQKVTGQRVSMTIKPASKRVIEVVASANPDGSCRAEAFATLSRKRARLTLIFITLAGPFAVSKVELRGADPETGAPISEIVTP